MTLLTTRAVRRFAPIAAAVASLFGSPAHGQVGYPPTNSPYHDVERTQEITLLFGYYHAHRDPANVGPQSGTLSGIHYEWRPAGPTELIAEFSRVESQHRVINPLRSGPLREMGTKSTPLYSGDIGIGANLTGGKSWHHLVPEVSTGIGVVSDAGAPADSGGFRLGTRFAIRWGGGIKWLVSERWQIRGDITNHLHTLSYPEAYYGTPSGVTPVIPSTQNKSFWINNPALTIGLSRLF